MNIQYIKVKFGFSIGLPNSPVGKEKSIGRSENFWIFCALDIAFLLAASMPFCIASKTSLGLFATTSDTLVNLQLSDDSHETTSGVKVSSGSAVSASTSH